MRYRSVAQMTGRLRKINQGNRGANFQDEIRAMHNMRAAAETVILARSLIGTPGMDSSRGNRRGREC
jgi:hypothetical protein